MRLFDWYRMEFYKEHVSLNGKACLTISLIERGMFHFLSIQNKAEEHE